MSLRGIVLAATITFTYAPVSAQVTALTDPSEFSAGVTSIDFESLVSSPPGNVLLNTQFLPLVEFGTFVNDPALVQTGPPSMIPATTSGTAAAASCLSAKFGQPVTEVGMFVFPTFLNITAGSILFGQVTLSIFDSDDIKIGDTTAPLLLVGPISLLEPQFIGLRSTIPFSRVSLREDGGRNCFSDDFTFGPLELTTVAIDIKPGSDPNCFNNNGHGVIPVAILGTAEFDPTEINDYSLMLDGLQVRVRGNKGPICSVEDSNGDSYLDLVCHFEDEANNWSEGEAIATLTGELTDGTLIQGTDSICVVP